MSDILSILLSAGVRKDATAIKRIQADLDSIAKQLKLELVASGSSIKKTVEQLKNQTGEVNKQSELYIKLWKAQEKAEARRRQADDAQNKAVQKELDLKEKILQADQKLRQTIEQQKKAELEKSKTIEQQVLNYQKAMQIKIQDAQRKYSGLINTEELNNLNTELSKLTNDNFTPENKKKIDNMFNSMVVGAKSSSSAVREAAQDVTTLGQELVRAGKKFLQWYLLAGGITSVVNWFKDGIKIVTEMNTALTSLSKVVNFSTSDLNGMTVAAVKLGKELGKSSVQIMQGMAEFGRIAKSKEDIVELTRVATMASNVTSLTAQEAAKAISSTMVTFGLEISDAITVLDSFNEIQNNFRVTAEDLAASISKIGAASKIAKTDMQTLEGVITSIIQSTGIDGSEAGTAVKSFMSRIYRTDESDPEELGKTAKALKRIVDVTVEGTNGLKPFGELLTEIAGKWKNLSEQDKIALAQSIGSTYHYSKFIALMENYQIAIDASAKAYSSFGSAIEENEKQLNSIQGRIGVLKVATESLFLNAISSDTVKVFVDFATVLVNVIDKIGLLNSILLGTITYFTFFKTSALFLPIINAATAGIAKLTAGLNLSTAAAIKLNTVMGMLTPALIVAGVLALIEAIKWLAEAHERQIELINKLKKEYDSLHESLDKNKSKVEEITKRLKELYTLRETGTITSAEDEELIKLEKVNETLKHQIEYEKALIKIKGEALERETLKASEAKTEYREKAIPSDVGSNFVDLTVSEAIEYDTERLKKYDNELENIINTKEKLQKTLIELQKDQSNNSKEIQKTTNEIQKLEKQETDLTAKRAKYVKSLEALVIKLEEENEKYVGATEAGNEKKKSNEELIKTIQDLIIGLDQEVDIVNTVGQKYEEAAERQAKAQSELTTEFEKFKEKTDDTFDSLSSLSDAYSTLANNEELSLKSVIELVNKYPQLASYINQTNDATFNRGKILKQVWEIEKDIELKRLRGQQKQLEEEYKFQEALLLRTDQTALYAGILTPEMEEIKDQLRLNKALQKIYEEVGIEDFKSKTSTDSSTSKTLTQLILTDQSKLTEAFIKSANAQAQITEQQEKSLKAQQKLADSQKDYNKQIEITKKLISNEQQQISDLQTANEKINQRANEIRAGATGYDTTQWFDPTGESTAIYDNFIIGFTDRKNKIITEMNKLEAKSSLTKVEKEQLKSFENQLNALETEQKYVEDLFTSLQKLKKAWYENADSIIALNDDIASSNQKIIDIKKEELEVLEKEAEQTRKNQIESQKQLLEKYKQQEESLKNIIDLTTNLIKQEYQDIIDKLEDQLDAHKEITDEIKKQIKLQEANDDYRKDEKKKQDEILKLQRQITQLSRDDSRQAQAEKLKLEEDLAKKQEDLSEFRHDRDIELQLEALDEGQKAFEDKQKEEIDKYKQKLSEAGTLQQEAITRINDALATGSDTLYGSLISWNQKYGSSIQDDIVSAWKNAKDAMLDYQSSSGGLNIEGAMTKTREAQIIAQMQQNSISWHGATSEERIRLHEENIRLAKQLSGSVEFLKGKWWQNGIPIYGQGAYVDKPHLSVVGDRPEFIIPKENIMDFVNKVNMMNIPVPKMPNFNPLQNSNALKIDSLITINGNADRTILPDLERIANIVVDKINNGFYKVGKMKPIRTLG